MTVHCSHVCVFTEFEILEQVIEVTLCSQTKSTVKFFGSVGAIFGALDRRLGSLASSAIDAYLNWKSIVIHTGTLTQIIRPQPPKARRFRARTAHAYTTKCINVRCQRSPFTHIYKYVCSSTRAWCMRPGIAVRTSHFPCTGANPKINA